MAKKVLSIEIGPQVTKVAVVDYLKRNPHVYTAFSFDTPSDVMEDGFVRDKAQMAQVLQAQMKEHGVREKEAVFSIASSRIASREVVFPFVSDSKLDDLVHATAQDYFPVNIEEYTLAYMVQDTIKEGDKKSLKVSLLAAPDSLIQNYYAFAEELGVHIESLDYYGNGSMQVLSKHVVSGYCICVQMGSVSTMVSVLSEGRQIMQRTISYGANTIVNAVLEQSDLQCSDAGEAMELLSKENVLYSTLDYDDLEGVNAMRVAEDTWKRSQESEESRQAVTDSAGGIILNILRVIDYFHSKNADVDITALYLTGIGVKIRGIDLLFANEMGLPVQRLETLSNVTFARSFAQGEQTEYIAVIGAAMAPIDFRLKSLVAKEAKRETMRAIHLVFAMAVVVAAVLVGVSALQYKDSLDQKADLEEQINSLAYIKEVYTANTVASAKFAETQVIDGAASSKNKDLNDLITQLEKNLPSMMQVSFLQSSDAGISMTIETKTKISVARMLMNLERIKALTNFQISALNGDDKGKSVSFTVTASYAADVDDSSSEDSSEGGSEPAAQ